MGKSAVAEGWTGLSDRVKMLAVDWAAYAALGSFVLYMLGYLTLRFHLTALGIGTDLSVLDERYLFTGAKFLVYLVSTVPIVVGLGLVLAAVLSLCYWLLSKTRAAALLQPIWMRRRAWCLHPLRLTLVGIVLAVLMIQLVMRQCFFFSNLLLAPRPPQPAWLGALLLTPNDGPRALYFAALVAGTALTAAFFWRVRASGPQPAWSDFLLWLLGFLVAVEGLMLPVNYGILIADKTMPRVASLGDQQVLETGQDAWLVWEGKDGMTYLLRQRRGEKETRALVTLPYSEVKRIEITGYDPIIRILFAGPPPQALSGPPESGMEQRP
jgi:hypothetical protein